MESSRRRTRALIALFGLAAAAVVGLMNGLASCLPDHGKADRSRPVSTAEAQRLAGVRLRDQQDGHAGFRATVGPPGAAVHLTGWVDWRRPLLYLGSVADRPGPADGLVQVVPDLVAARLGRLGSADDPYPPPPAQPPTEGWRVRRLTPDSPAGTPLDSLFALLLGLRADKPDDAAALTTGARFQRRDLLGGVPVDVVAGPAVLPPSLMGPVGARPTPSAASQVTYWLDDGSHLRRLDTYLRKDLPVRVDFNRDDRAVPAAIAPLGGGPVAPRPVTAAEAGLLARVGARNKSARGGRVRVEVPVSPAGLLRADGWLDWRATAAYLATRNPDDPSQDALVWADRTGVSTRTMPDTAPVPAGGVPESPRPTPSAVPTSPPPPRPPIGGWRTITWAEHDTQGSSDLDVLLGAALAGLGDATTLRKRASWLREDTLDGVPVIVYEVRGAAEAGTAPGDGLLRYWVDRSGLLHRVEVRTGDRAYGSLDVSVGPVPALSPPSR